MSDFAVEGGALKKMIAHARKKPLSFGFNPGKSPGEHMLGLDRRKSPELIGRSVKASGPGVKVAFGTCEVDAKVLTMTCEKLVPMMAKRVKLFLKYHKVMLNVRILGPDGAVLEEDIEEFADDAELDGGGTDAGSTAPEPKGGGDGGNGADEPAGAAKPADLDGRAGALAVRLRALRPGIAAAPDAVRQKLVDAMAGVVAMIRGQEFDDATEALGRLETIVARVAAPMPEVKADPRVAKLEQAAQVMAQSVAGLPEGAARQRLEARLADIGELIAAGDVAAGIVAIREVQSALKSPAPETGDAARQQRELVALIGRIKEISIADADRSHEIVALARQASAALKAGETGKAKGLIAELRSVVGTEARPEAVLGIWRDARDETGAQFGQLQDAMKNSGLPLLERIADRGLNSITETRLVALQAGLMEVDAAQGEARDKAVRKAAAAVSEMRDFLNTNPVLPLLEANPLKIPLTLRATLGKALDDIDRALTA
jgi:hypothetical protein